MGRMVTAIEAARLAGLGEKTIRRMLVDGRLPAVKDGHDWAIDSDVLALVTGSVQDRALDLFEQLHGRVESLEARVRELEAGRATSVVSVAPVLVMNQSDAPISKRAAARISGEHGAKFNTADKWPWPAEVRQRRETVVSYAHARMGGETRKNWHECTIARCSCHDKNEL